jgi:hypothetical protein
MDPNQYQEGTELAAFMSQAQPDARGCWLWQGVSGEYGRYRGKAAHRASWELHHGPIADGLIILHGCDVKGCVNPAHLRPGTMRENAADRRRASAREPRASKGPRAWTTTDPAAPRTRLINLRVNDYEHAVLRYLRVAHGSVQEAVLRIAMKEGHRLLELYEDWSPPHQRETVST